MQNIQMGRTEILLSTRFAVRVKGAPNSYSLQVLMINGPEAP